MVRVIHHNDDADLTWIVDPDADARAAAKHLAPEASAVGNITETGYDFDAAVIATPALDHDAHATDLVRRGKHVLVEKPATLSRASADALVASAGARAVTLMVGHQLVYHAGFKALVAEIRAGRIGTVTEMAAVRTTPLDLSKEPGVIWSLGPHDVAMMISVINCRPDRVSCRYAPNGLPNEAVHAHIDLEFGDIRNRGGIHGRIRLISTAQDKMRAFTVRGTEGALVLDDAGPACTLSFFDTIDRETPLAIPDIDTEALAFECDGFLQAILTGTEPLTGKAHIAAVAAILERCVTR